MSESSCRTQAELVVALKVWPFILQVTLLTHYQDMVIDIPSLAMPDKLCESCLVGKQSRKSFITHMPIMSSCILEVVHSDVCGPFEGLPIGGNK